jgi:hypothetical protein
MISVEKILPQENIAVDLSTLEKIKGSIEKSRLSQLSGAEHD